jgi:RPA family protein
MRQVATKIYVKELLDGQYEQKEGWDPNILHCARGKVTRCNIIGTLLRTDAQYTLDDGTGQIGLRAYDEIPGLQTEDGTVVQVIARPREYQDTVFLVAEIIKPIDTQWAAVRKAQLGSPQEFDSSHLPKKKVEEEKEEPEKSNNAEKIIDIISQLDDGSGASIEEVISKANMGELAEDIVNQLLLDGEIFEIKPGILKVL